MPSKTLDNTHVHMKTLAADVAKTTDIKKSAEIAVHGLITSMQMLKSRLHQTGNGLTATQGALFETTLNAMSQNAADLIAAIPANTVARPAPAAAEEIQNPDDTSGIDARRSP